ncbi:MAG: phosphoenolpyruvate synthase [Candidatus Nanoarchaeia archaeon]
MNWKNDAHILWFDQLTIDDVPLVGGKNASLGEMYVSLTPKGVRIPNGFAITAKAYHYVLKSAGIKEQLQELLRDLDTGDVSDLARRGKKARHIIKSAPFPQDLIDVIKEAYHHLQLQYGKLCDVAVRSSATAEDLPDASFAGQQETYLNVVGEEELINSCKKCFASLFTDRAISYREEKGFDHFSIGLSIGVQKMVRSDKAASGVMFSIDTESGFENVVFITSAYGLGETVVQGAVNPDEFVVFKPTLRQGKKSIISKQLGSKKIKMVYDHGGNKLTKNVFVDKKNQNYFAITDDEVLELARWAVIIEDHYSQKARHYKPMDMEWAKDGESGELFIVQARPETVQSRTDRSIIQTYHLEEHSKILVQGKSVGQKVAVGPAKILHLPTQLSEFKEGEVLVTEMTDPDWEPIMKKASAIVTNSGGRTCHAAIISRELGLPCVVGTDDATKKIQNGQEITVDCSSGDDGFVYEGELKFVVDEKSIGQIPKTKTKIMMNLANPELAFAQSFIPCDGVGLAREEFIVSSHIKIHPLALIHYDDLKNKEDKKQIDELTKGYDDKRQYFVDNLSFGIAKIAAAFYPKPVILRMSDFKTNEYANLIGGKEFEPLEDNPMIGWRGASRYYQGPYKAGFALECQAVKKVREEYGLTNLELMVPFCRTINEAHKVIAEFAKHGLKQGENGLKIIGMCEIPSNVLLAEEFLDIFDGFSIGSNDLTQLTLGIDRDNETLSDEFDERNPAVKKLVKQVINVANKKGKYIGICGQGPSDHQDFAEFLVRSGIQTMSLNPDTVIKTTLAIAKQEESLGLK